MHAANTTTLQSHYIYLNIPIPNFGSSFYESEININNALKEMHLKTKDIL